jgi:hypothetical protein
MPGAEQITDPPLVADIKGVHMMIGRRAEIVVGLSILSGAHMTLVPRIVDLLKVQGVDDVLITVGGTIPAQDIPELERLGVTAVFTPAPPPTALSISSRAPKSPDGQTSFSRHTPALPSSEGGTVVATRGDAKTEPARL